MENGNTALLTTFALIEGVHAFAIFMPSSFTAKKFGSSTGDKAKLRSGYIPAIILNVGLGLVLSKFSKSLLPLFATLFTSVLMVAFYEFSMGGSPVGKVDMAGAMNTLGFTTS